MFASHIRRMASTSTLGRKAALPASLNRTYGPWIGGRIVIDTGAEKLSIEDPADGSELAYVHQPTPAHVSSALTLAQDTFDSGTWSRASAVYRSKVLSKMATLLEERVGEMAEVETLQTGRPIREMKAQLSRLPEWLHYFSALLRTYENSLLPTTGPLLNYTTRIPLGVVALITPFNHPLLIAVKKIAPALAAGNAVIVKPSELAPLTVLQFAELAQDAGLPDGVLSVLPGVGPSVGKQIIESPLVRKVDLTGGTEAGRAIGRTVGGNLASYTAELGGKAPILIFDDIDLDLAVNGVCFASFIASGQTCVSGTRILVQESILPTFLEKLKEKCKSIEKRMGDPANPSSTMGPVISSASLSRVQSFMSSAISEGATVLTGGKRLEGSSQLDGFDRTQGYFFPPTVLVDVTTNSRVWKEEVFGPVICVMPFKDEPSAIRLANDSQYGLGAAVWTSNGARGHRVAAGIEAGLVWINSHHRNDPSSPWGGMKDSGIGRENGLEAFRAYTQTKSVIMSTASEEQALQTDDWFADDGSEKRYG